MRPDDPGADPPAGARSRPSTLWSYDGGWKSPSTPPGARPDGELGDEGRVRRAVVGSDGGEAGEERAQRGGRAVLDSDGGEGGDERAVRGRPAHGGGVDGARSARGRRSARDGSRERPQRGGAGPPARRGSDEAPGHPEDATGDPESVARAICLRLLTLQPRTRAELAAALAKRGVPDDAATTVLSRFTEVGLIDDRAFAAAWVDSRHAGRGLARRALAAELRRRGVDGEIVGEAVAVVDAAAEERAARQLVDRRLAGTRRLDQPARIRRLAGMLARKGYPAGLAMRVVRDALAAEGADPGELDEWDDAPAED